MLAVITVDTAGDVVDFNDGVTSLREAIFAANTVPGADEIVFAPALFANGPRIIHLTQGELTITESLTIAGPGATQLTIDARGSDPTPELKNGDGSRLFLIDGGPSSPVFDVAFRDLTLTGGDAGLSGGAILSAANLELTRCSFSSNAAGGDGGAIASKAGPPRTLQVAASTIVDNRASSFGGGVYWNGNFAIAGTELSRNQAVRGGGAFLASSTVPTDVIQECVISANAAQLGSGIYWNGLSIEIIGSSITGNGMAPLVLREGGGLFLSGQKASISNCTISENFASVGGGVRSLFGTIEILSTNVSNNQATRSGGGISSSSSLSITESEINGNFAGFLGGGIAASRIVMRQCIVDGNVAGTLDAPRPSGESLLAFQGGGINANEITVDASIISNNFAADRGGGVHSAFGTISNSTIYENTANQGGGVSQPSSNLDSLWIQHSTIVRNHAVTNRGVVGDSGGVRGGRLRIRNSIVAQNDSSGTSPDLRYQDAINRFSLIGDTGGLANIVEAPLGSPDANGNLIGGPTYGVIDPMLGPLSDNGGPTETFAPLAGSPAIDAGSLDLPPGAPLGPPEFDQREAPYSRLTGSRVDMGAVELQTAGGVLSGDFDFDGFVNGTDFLAWQRGLGRTGVVTIRHGDATADGDVHANDLAVWKARAGEAVSYEPSAMSQSGGESVRAARVIDAVFAAGDFSGSFFVGTSAPLARGKWRPARRV